MANLLVGLQVLDISAPANPQRVGVYVTGGSSSAVAISGNYALLADTEALQVIDTSDSANPKRVSSFNSPARDVTVSGNYAYVAGDGLQVIDISDPTDPRPIGAYLTGGSPHALAISGAYACLATTTAPGGLEVIDISDPTTPQRVGAYTNSGSLMDVAVDGNYAFVAGVGGHEVEVIDFSNPANPQRVAGFNTASHVLSITVSGKQAYLAETSVPTVINGTVYPGTDLEIIDISDPVDPRLIGRHESLASSTGIAISGDYAFVSNNGLQVLDISNPSNPRVVGGNSDFYSTGVAVSQGKVFLAAGADGLGILELTPFIRSVSKEGQNLKISWEAFGPARLQRATQCARPEWQDVPGCEATNTTIVPIGGGSEFFRLAKP